MPEWIWAVLIALAVFLPAVFDNIVGSGLFG